MEPILKIEDLVVEYRTREFGQRVRIAVNRLSLEVFPGEVFGFLGPNGAGKTTTMNVLLGFVPATRGAAYVFNVNVRDPIARQRIGYLPELTYYYKFLTAEELLRFYARIFRIPRAEVGPRVDEVLKLVELDAARKRPIKTYSKGMQQRVGLAQALINNPDLLILDEPTSGLDPIGRMKVREIIERLKQEGKTVFFSSHELGEVETVCDRVAILQQGELKVEGNVQDLVRHYRPANSLRAGTADHLPALGQADQPGRVCSGKVRRMLGRLRIGAGHFLPLFPGDQRVPGIGLAGDPLHPGLMASLVPPRNRHR